MPWADLALVAAGAAFAGFSNGLTGTGTAMVALAFWLHAVPPAVAGPLAALCAIAGHLQAAPMIWRTMDRARAWPFLVAGVAGVPVGLALADRVAADPLKLALGLFLVAYCVWTLAARRVPAIVWGGPWADAAIGLGGGLLGGMAGLSGPLPTVWAQLRGWGKDVQRGVYQPFNLAVLALTFALFAAAGGIDREFLWLALLALPGNIMGTQLGLRCYGRIDDALFRRLVVGLLGASGVALVASRLV